MAQFPKIQLTRLGKNMIIDGQNKKPVAFTKVELGDGLLSGQSVEELTALVHSVMSVPLQNFTNNGDGTAHLRFVLDNNDLDKGFFNREIGVYAKVGDGTEQLYAYTNAGNLADYIPGKESPISSKIINLHIIVGNAVNLTIVAENSAYATKLDMDGHKTQEVLDHPDGSVTTPKIRDEAVTGAKIAQASIEKKHLKKGGISAEDVGAYSKGETDEKINAHRTAAELDHPDKSVKRKHLADNVYTLPKPEAANNARFLRNDGTWQQVTADNIGACNKADVAGIYRKIGDQIVDRNTDWNTLTEPMTYIVNGASIDDMHHAPSEYNFGVLDVLRTFCEPEKRIIQIYYPHFSQQTVEKGGMWIRFSNNDIWTQWRHIPTKAENDDRYVKKSGDKLTGTLFAPKIQADDGFEAQGDAGLFFKKYGGGWYMSDDYWMRAYGGKGIHTSGKIACAGGFEGTLRGKADSAGNSDNLGGQSLQRIIDKINAAKTGIVAGNLAQNGWVKFANGLIVQWGLSQKAYDSYVAFPVSYPQQCFCVQVSSRWLNRGNPYECFSLPYDIKASGFSFRMDGGDNQVLWIAIGI